MNLEKVKTKIVEKGDGSMQFNERGITLIALIITVIIIVVLSVVTINSINNMAIVGKTQNAVQQYAQRAVEENEMLDSLVGLLDNALKNNKQAAANPVDTSEEEESNNEHIILQSNQFALDGVVYEFKAGDTWRDAGAGEYGESSYYYFQQPALYDISNDAYYAVVSEKNGGAYYKKGTNVKLLPSDLIESAEYVTIPDGKITFKDSGNNIIGTCDAYKGMTYFTLGLMASSKNIISHGFDTLSDCIIFTEDGFRALKDINGNNISNFYGEVSGNSTFILDELPYYHLIISEVDINCYSVNIKDENENVCLAQTVNTENSYEETTISMGYMCLPFSYLSGMEFIIITENEDEHFVWMYDNEMNSYSLTLLSGNDFYIYA